MAGPEGDAACTESELSGLMATFRRSEPQGMSQLERLLLSHPDDARLHFLKGSVLAARQEYAAAQSAMRRAVDISPEYWIARFQLGFLYFTSGNASDALDIWRPLGKLPREHYLRLFSDGLRHLSRDEFGEAVRLLSEGIKSNHENAALNQDMHRITYEISKRRLRAAATRPFQVMSSWFGRLR